MSEPAELAAQLAAIHAASYGWALACCERRAHDATDVLQDAYAKVLSGAARFDGRSSLKTWFFGVVRRTAQEHRRSGVVRWLFPERARATAEAAAPSQRAADASLADRELATVVAAALAQLSPKQREVLHLVFYEELSIAEAAAIMGVSLGTARLHYDRGKKNMHALLAQQKVTIP